MRGFGHVADKNVVLDGAWDTTRTRKTVYAEMCTVTERRPCLRTLLLYLDSSASGNVECVATCHACENTLGRPPPPLHRLSNQGTEDITAVAMQLQYSGRV